MFTLYTSQSFLWIVPNPDHSLNNSLESRQEFTFVPGFRSNSNSIDSSSTISTGLTTSNKQHLNNQQQKQQLANDHFNYCILFDRRQQQIVLIDRDTGTLLLDDYLHFIFGLTTHKDLLSPFTTHQMLPVYPLPTANTQKRTIYGILGVHRLIRGLYLEVISQIESMVNIYGKTIYKVIDTDIICISSHYPREDLNRNYVLQDEEVQNVVLLKKALSSLSLHFSYNYDITLSLQKTYDFSTLQLQQATCYVTSKPQSLSQSNQQQQQQQQSLDIIPSTSIVNEIQTQKAKKMNKKLDDDKKSRQQKKKKIFDDDDQLFNNENLDTEPKSIFDETSVIPTANQTHTTNVNDNDDESHTTNNIHLNSNKIDTIIQYPEWTYSQFTSQLLSRAESEYFTNRSPLVILFTEIMYSYQTILQQHFASVITVVEERVKSNGKGKIDTYNDDILLLNTIRSLIIQSPSSTAPLPGTNYPSVISAFIIIASHSYINSTHHLELIQNNNDNQSIQPHDSQQQRYQLNKYTTIMRISRFNVGPRSLIRGINNLGHAGNFGQVEFITEVYHSCQQKQQQQQQQCGKLGTKQHPLQFALFAISSYLTFRGSPPCLQRDTSGSLSPLLLSPVQIDIVDDIAHYQELAHGSDYFAQYPPQQQQQQPLQTTMNEYDSSQQPQPLPPPPPPQQQQQQDPLRNKQRVVQLISQHCANIIQSNFQPSYLDNRTITLDNPYITMSLHSFLNHKLLEHYLPNEQVISSQSTTKRSSNCTTLQNEQFYNQLVTFSDINMPLIGPKQQLPHHHDANNNNNNNNNGNNTDNNHTNTQMTPYQHFYETDHTICDIIRSERERVLIALSLMVVQDDLTPKSTPTSSYITHNDPNTKPYQQLFSPSFEPLLRVCSLLTSYRSLPQRQEELDHLQPQSHQFHIYNHPLTKFTTTSGHNARLINPRIINALSRSHTQYLMSQRAIKLRQHIFKYLPTTKITSPELLTHTGHIDNDLLQPRSSTLDSSSQSISLPHITFVDLPVGTDSQFISALRHSLAREGCFLAIVPNFLHSLASSKILDINTTQKDLSSTYHMTYYLNHTSQQHHQQQQQQEQEQLYNNDLEHYFHCTQLELVLHTPFAYQIPLPSYTQMLVDTYQPPLTSTFSHNYRPFSLVQISRQISYSRFNCLDSIDRTGKAIIYLYPNHLEYISTYLFNLISFTPTLLKQLPLYSINPDVGHLDALPWLIRFTGFIREYLILHSLGIEFHPPMQLPVSSASKPTASLATYKYYIKSLPPQLHHTLFDQLVQVNQQFTLFVTSTFLVWVPNWNRFQSSFKELLHLSDPKHYHRSRSFVMPDLMFQNDIQSSLPHHNHNNNSNNHNNLPHSLIFTTAHQSHTPQYMEGYYTYQHHQTVQPFERLSPLYYTQHQNANISAIFYHNNYNAILSNLSTLDSLHQHITPRDKSLLKDNTDNIHTIHNDYIQPQQKQLAYAINRVITINPYSLHTYLNISPPILHTITPPTLEYTHKPTLPTIYFTNSTQPIVVDDCTNINNNLYQINILSQIPRLLFAPMLMCITFGQNILQLIRMNTLFQHLYRRYVDNFDAPPLYEALAIYFTNYLPSRALLPFSGFIVKQLPPTPPTTMTNDHDNNNSSQQQQQQPPRFGMFQIYEHVTSTNVETTRSTTFPNPNKFTRDFNPYTRITKWLPLIGAFMVTILILLFIWLTPFVISIPDLRPLSPLSPRSDLKSNLQATVITPISEHYQTSIITNSTAQIPITFDVMESVEIKYQNVINNLHNNWFEQFNQFIFAQILTPNQNTPLSIQQCIINQITTSLTSQRDDILKQINMYSKIHKYNNIALIRNVPINTDNDDIIQDELIKALYTCQQHLSVGKSMLYSLLQHQHFGHVDFLNISLLSNTILYRDCQAEKLFTPQIESFIAANLPSNRTQPTFLHYESLTSIQQQTYCWDLLGLRIGILVSIIIVPTLLLWFIMHFALFYKLRFQLRLQRHWFSPPIEFSSQLQHLPIIQRQPPPPTTPHPNQK